MTIKLKEWKIIDLSFNSINSPEEVQVDKNVFNLAIESAFPEEEDNTFGTVFKLKINNKSVDLSIEAFYLFEVDEMTEEFKVSDFPKVNAPAIAFPYLRAFISTVTLQAGIDPIILPSINFIEMNKKSKENE